MSLHEQRQFGWAGKDGMNCPSLYCRPIWASHTAHVRLSRFPIHSKPHTSSFRPYTCKLLFWTPNVKSMLNIEIRSASPSGLRHHELDIYITRKLRRACGQRDNRSRRAHESYPSHKNLSQNTPYRQPKCRQCASGDS